MSFSIWLMPKGELYQNLYNTISNLAERYSAPIFEPHVTLIGSLTNSCKKLLELSSNLAHSLKPFDVSLTNLDQGNEYFRCVYLTSESGPEIIEANQLTKKIFGSNENTRFEPHLSLIYGKYPKTVRDEIISELETTFKPFTFTINELYLVLASSRIPPAEWEIMDKFRLAPR